MPEVRDIVINVCYLAEKIIDHVGDGARYGVRIHYSLENDGLLGTGGGIRRALPLLGDQPFWVVSADVWSEYHFSLSPADVAWDSTDAYLLMVPNPIFHPQGDYGINLHGKLVPQPPHYTYASMGLMHPRFFADMQTDIFELSRVIDRAMLRNRICAELYTGPWFNVGDIEQLERLRDYVALS